ncbi:hypothetical protein J8273_6227 [Carpediemonas membranifera]|uniref:Uncharacterized protein n=1 Tax=Carpediemonas membranifera TaxID=201153 RepID=A0A8J6B798_9EUKA|nr:hypothetical protein J8273_6227 [Carpediemonas membranifera]|eukprot:KAG9391467.1 hypothetical protein J8273_6227 [Carpediemonas membranifera]
MQRTQSRMSAAERITTFFDVPNTRATLNSRPKHVTIPRYTTTARDRVSNLEMTVATVGLDDKSADKITSNLRERFVNVQPVSSRSANVDGKRQVLVRAKPTGSGCTMEDEKIVEVEPPRSGTLMTPADRRRELEYEVQNQLAARKARQEETYALKQEVVRRRNVASSVFLGMAPSTGWVADTDQETVSSAVHHVETATDNRKDALIRTQGRHFTLDPEEKPTVGVQPDADLRHGKKFIAPTQSFNVEEMTKKVPMRGPGEHGRRCIERDRRGRTYDLLAPDRAAPEWDMDYVID